MQRNLINVLLLAVIGGGWLAPGSSGAETYKWTDANGEVHYSDQPPPPNVKDQATIKSRKAAAPATAPDAKQKDPAAAKPKTYLEQEADFRKRKVEAAEREAAEKKKADEAAKKEKNCEQAQAEVKSLQAGGRITKTNAQGEREYLSDAEIAQELERRQKVAASWCN